MNNLHTQTNLSMPLSALAYLIEKTKFAMATDNELHVLNGLKLESDGNFLRTVATDGHCLAICSLDVSPEMPTFSAIIPNEAVIELANFISYFQDDDEYDEDDDEYDEDDNDYEVVLDIKNDYLKISLGYISFTTKLMDGKFPDYYKVLPSEPTIILELDSENLINALSTMAYFSKTVKLELSDNLLNITVQNNQNNTKYNYKLNISYQGISMKIGFNANYLIDMLENLECERVRMHFTDSLSACLIEDCDDDSLKYVVMPMKLP